MKESNDSALYLSWLFFKNNLGVSFGVIGIFILLILLGLIPLLGFIFDLALTFFIISVGAFFAKAVTKIKSEEEMVELAKKTTFKSFLFDNLGVAVGSYLGSLLIMIVLFAIIGIIGAIAASGYDKMVYYGTFSFGALILTVIDVLLLIVFFYIYPAVMGESYMAESFGEAFKRVFLFLNPKFWVKTFNAKYMILISIWMLVVPSAFFLAIITSFVLIGIVLLFIVTLYNAAVFGYAYNIVEKTSQQENSVVQTQQIESDSSENKTEN